MMKKLLSIAILAAAPWLAWAQSGIDGVWKTDPKTVTAGDKPSRYLVKGGEYRCDSCAPRIKVRADGTHQPLPGNPYIDQLAVKVVDDHTLEITATKDGRALSTGRITVSPDGKSLTRDVTSYDPNGTTSTSTEKLVRVGAVPRGVHPVSGTWKFTAIDRMSDEVITFKTASGTLIMNASDGSSYDAPMDGTRATYRNSPGIDQVSVKAKSGETFEETSWAGDKPLWVNTMIVSPDGTRMKVLWEDKLRGSRGSYVMVRQ
jgi:hypothetical protein